MVRKYLFLSLMLSTSLVHASSFSDDGEPRLHSNLPRSSNELGKTPVGITSNLYCADEIVKIVGPFENLEGQALKDKTYEFALKLYKLNRSKEHHAESFRILKELSDEGMAWARVGHAVYLSKGIGCKDTFENKLKGEAILQDILDGDNAEKIYVYGLFIYQGYGFDPCEENANRGIELIKKSVAMGNPKAKSFYEYWLRNKAIGLEKCVAGAKNGNPEDIERYGALLLFGKSALLTEQELVSGFNLIKELAEKGNPKAMLIFAQMLAEGKVCAVTKENLKLSLSFCQKSAKTGDVKALNEYANMLCKGIGCKVTQEGLIHAQSLYKAAAEKGLDDAMYNYAAMLRKNTVKSLISEEKKLELTLYWRKRAADAGHIEAMYFYAYMLENGKGCDITDETLSQALFYYKKTADKGHVKAMYKYAEMLENGQGCKASEQNLDEVFFYYKKAAEAGHLDSMYCYAHFLSKGKGCKKTKDNTKRAFEWFKKAADAGHLLSKLDYAYMLEKGKGCDVTQANLKLALAYYKDAADNGEEEAMHRYSLMLKKGKVCKVTPETLSLALSYSKKSAEAGYLDGMYAYAKMLETGQGCDITDETLSQALFYYKKAADEGHVNAMYKYAEMLEIGQGCDITDETLSQALSYYKKAAKKDHVDAMFSCAHFLENGIGCKKNPENLKLAVYWYKKAANEGLVSAMSAYASMIFDGLGCEKSEENLSEALYWYKEAGEAGVKNARYNYACMLFNGKGCPKTEQNKKLALEIFKQAAHEGATEELHDYLRALESYVDEFGGREYIDELERVIGKVMKDLTTEGQGYAYKRLAFYYFKYSKGIEDLKKAQDYYKKAEHYGADVSRILDYIKHKTSQKTAVGPKSKKNMNAVEKMIELSRDQKKTEAENLSNKLRIELNLLKKNQDCNIDIDSLLANLANADKAYNKSEKSNVSSTKLTHIHKFQTILDGIEKKVFVEIGRLDAIEVKKNINSLSMDSGSDVLYGLDLKSEPSVKKLVRQNAEGQLQKEKDKEHKKNQKKKKKGKKKKAQAQPLQDKTEDDVLKTVCPYAEAQLVHATNAKIPEAAKKNAYKVLSTVKAAASHNDLLHLLNGLPGDYKLTLISPEYSGVPNSDIAFEMRINSQFRVVLAFKKGQNGKQNLDLYKNQIIICDPHV